MKLFLFDIESSGLDYLNDRILEIGYIFRDTEFKKPMVMSTITLNDKNDPSYSKNPADHINHIYPAHCEVYGMDVRDVFNYLEGFFVKHKPDYMVAHNGNAFDVPFLFAQLEKYEIKAPTIRTTPTIDTRYDLPVGYEPRSRHLGHLGYDHGIINLFPHAALTDCLVMDALVEKYGIDKILEFKFQPKILLKALVGKEDKDKAKFSGYRYNPADYSWTKEIKASELEKEVKVAREKNFQIKAEQLDGTPQKTI